MINLNDRTQLKALHRQMGLKAFFKKFGSIKTPNCAVCSANSNSKYVKVRQFKVDYDPEQNYLIFKVKCHGDEMWLYRKYDETMRLNQLETRMFFKENQGYRQDGIIRALLTRRHALDDTIAY